MRSEHVKLPPTSARSSSAGTTGSSSSSRRASDATTSSAKSRTGTTMSKPRSMNSKLSVMQRSRTTRSSSTSLNNRSKKPTQRPRRMLKPPRSISVQTTPYSCHRTTESASLSTQLPKSSAVWAVASVTIEHPLATCSSNSTKTEPPASPDSATSPRP